MNGVGLFRVFQLSFVKRYENTPFSQLVATCIMTSNRYILQILIIIINEQMCLYDSGFQNDTNNQNNKVVTKLNK